MAKFAKLIELENNEQVLLTSNYNHDKDIYEVHIRTDLEDCVAEVKNSGYKNEEEALLMIENFSREKAIEYRIEMESLCS